MRKSLFLVVVVFLFCGFVAKAGNVTIKGHAKGYEGGEISLLTMDEAISERLHVLASTKVGKDGSFYFNVALNTLTRAVLRVNWVNAHFWLQPNSMYEVVVPVPSNPLVSVNNRTKVPLVFKSLDDDDPNFVGSKLNEALDKGMDLLFQKTTTGAFERSFRTFTEQVSADLKGVKRTPFLDLKQKYALAAIEAEISINRKAIFEKYLKGVTEFPIWEPDFAQFIKTFYYDYAGLFDEYRSGDPILSGMKGQVPVYRLTELLENDDFLPNDTLREIVLAYGVFTSGKERQWQGILVTNYLRKMAAEFKTKEGKLVAKHLFERWGQNHRGGIVGEIVGVKATGVQFEMDPSEKDLTLYCFGVSNVESVVEDLIILRDLALRFRQNFQVQYISLDRNIKDFKAFSDRHFKLGIPITHYQFNEELVDRLGLVAVPSYILVNEDGRSLLNYCPRPSEGLDNMITEHIIRSKRRKQGLRH